jgi:hypothetical protein
LERRFSLRMRQTRMHRSPLKFARISCESDDSGNHK